MTVKKLKISFLVLIAILFVILEVLNFTTKKGNDAESSQSTAKREDTFVVGFDQNLVIKIKMANIQDLILT